MNTILLIIAITDFIFCMYWMIATLSGPFWFKFYSKILAILGLITSSIYFLKLLNISN